MARETDGRRVRYEHRREEILGAATGYALEHGIADLSLRKVAAAVGVSHATLVHHFSTRDHLVAEIVEHAVTRALLPPPDYVAQGDSLEVTWSYLRSPEGAAWTRLFLSISGLALYGEPVYAEALRRSLRVRTAALADGLRLLGCPDGEAEAFATTLLSRLRGLATDLYLTGDTERVDAAFAVLLSDSAERRERWRTG